MGIRNQIAEYLFLKKRDPKQERTQWMKYMHGMNRISLLVFIVGLLVMLFRWLFLK
jgi:purine-cytosine permease-like protein